MLLHLAHSRCRENEECSNSGEQTRTSVLRNNRSIHCLNLLFANGSGIATGIPLDKLFEYRAAASSLVTAPRSAEVPANAEQLSSVSASTTDRSERVHFIAGCPYIGDSIR